jgi:hypothetical protein
MMHCKLSDYRFSEATPNKIIHIFASASLLGWFPRFLCKETMIDTRSLLIPSHRITKNIVEENHQIAIEIAIGCGGEML